MTTATAEPTAAPAAPRATEDVRSERRLAYLLIAPAVVLMLVVTAYPIGYAVWLSLLRYNMATPEDTAFVGVSNYVTILTDRYWWTAFLVTLAITIISVAIELVLGMALALVMHRTIFGRGVVRTVVLIPYGIVTVVAAYSWYYAWTPGTGHRFPQASGSAGRRRPQRPVLRRTIAGSARHRTLGGRAARRVTSRVRRSPDRCRSATA